MHGARSRAFEEHDYRKEPHLSCCSIYLKRLRCKHSTRGSTLIFMRFWASCSPLHASQKNLSSPSKGSVALHAMEIASAHAVYHQQYRWILEPLLSVLLGRSQLPLCDEVLRLGRQSIIARHAHEVPAGRKWRPGGYLKFCRQAVREQFCSMSRLRS